MVQGLKMEKMKRGKLSGGTVPPDSEKLWMQNYYLKIKKFEIHIYVYFSKEPLSIYTMVR